MQKSVTIKLKEKWHKLRHALRRFLVENIFFTTSINNINEQQCPFLVKKKEYNMNLIFFPSISLSNKRQLFTATVRF